MIFQSLSLKIDRIPERTFLDLQLGTAYQVVDTTYRGPVDFLLSGHEAVPSPRVAAWRQKRRIPYTVDLRFFMNYNDQMQNLLRWVQDPRVIVVSNVWHPNISHERILFTDFWRDLTRAYHQKFQFQTKTRPLMLASWEDYQLAEINDRTQASRIWLSPSSTNTTTHRFRPRLFEFMQQMTSPGFLGNPKQNLVLYSNADRLMDLETNSFQPADLSIDETVLRYKFCPPHRAYYENSFVSIFSETVEHGSSLIVTEKTYFAFIQGHFILPFSCQGFTDRVRSFGFRFPSFIDYSYDQEANDEVRQTRYLNEVQRVCSWPRSQWQQLWNENIDIIQHNRDMMLNTDFGKVDFRNLQNPNIDVL